MSGRRAPRQASKPSWYGKSESTAQRHSRERGDASARHAQDRDSLQQSQQAELTDISDRHEQELQQARPGEQQSPDAPPSNMNSPNEVSVGRGARGGRAYGPAAGDTGDG